MDETYMWKAIRYVERNPLRARMVIRAEDYLWSSAAAHCGLRDDILLDRDFPPPGAIENWSEWLQIPNTEEEGRELRLHTYSGSPWCTPEFQGRANQQDELESGLCHFLERKGKAWSQLGNASQSANCKWWRCCFHPDYVFLNPREKCQLVRFDRNGKLQLD